MDVAGELLKVGKLRRVHDGGAVETMEAPINTGVAFRPAFVNPNVIETKRLEGAGPTTLRSWQPARRSKNASWGAWCRGKEG